MDLIFSSEDFIPATDQRGIGLYSYDKFKFEKFSFEIGARREIQKLIQKEFTRNFTAQ